MKSAPVSSLILHDSHPKGLPVVVGCPFQIGSKPFLPSSASVAFADGSVAQAQCEILNHPDPSGVQWIELSFNATAGGRAAVTLLQGSTASAHLVETITHGSMLQNERLRVMVDTRPENPPVSIEWRETKNDPWKPLGHLELEVVTEEGTACSIGAAARTVRVLRNGSLRGQVEVMGQLMGNKRSPSLHFRLTVELWAGFDALRVDCRLSHQVPKVPAIQVKQATLRGVWKVGEKAARHFVQCNHGDFYVPREVVNPNQVALVSDFTCNGVHVSEPSMLLDDHAYAPYLMPPTVNTEPWLGLKGTKAAVYAQVLDFAPTRPNRLDSAGSELSFHLVPDGNTTRWPQGRSIQQTCFFALNRPALGPLAHEGRAQPSTEMLVELNRFEMPQVLKHVPGKNLRIHGLLHDLCKLKMVGDKWNLGDTVDASYSIYYAGIPNRLEKLPGAPDFHPQFTPAGALCPQSSLQFIEPVWTNNEYDVLHALAQEICRTGKNDFLAALRWCARHNIDVDFCVFSDHRWHHRATPAHSAHHNTTGAYPSHFWTQGLLQYYLLTGDRDALEVAIALGDKTIENFNDEELRKVQYGFNREIGWGLLLLVALVETTGIARFREECDRLADYLQAYDRVKFTGAVNLSNGRPGRSLERQMIDNAFGYTSMVEAMDRYQRVSGRKDTEKWLLELLEELKRQTWISMDDGEMPSFYGMVPHMMAMGFERTGDHDYLEAGMVILENTLDAGISQICNGEIKTSAMVHRGFCRFAGHADRAGLLELFEFQTIRKHQARQAKA